MTEQQIPQLAKMMGELVAHQSGFNALPRADRQFVVEHPKAAIKTMVAAIRNRLKEPTEERVYRVLRPITPTPAARSTFKADETFFNKKSGVKMIGHSSNFTSWFAGKVEEDAPDGMLVPLVLTERAYDREIIADLGGEEKAEVTLAEIWRLMERQANGGEGALLVHGWSNVFYVRDMNEMLRAVDVRWYGNGWSAYAFAPGDYRWYGSGQVFSRNS